MSSYLKVKYNVNRPAYGTNSTNVYIAFLLTESAIYEIFVAGR